MAIFFNIHPNMGTSQIDPQKYGNIFFLLSQYENIFKILIILCYSFDPRNFFFLAPPLLTHLYFYDSTWQK